MAKVTGSKPEGAGLRRATGPVFLGIVLFFLSFTAQAETPWREIGSGVSFREMVWHAGSNAYTFQVIKTDLKKAQLKPILSDRIVFARKLLEPGAIAVSNANFFDQDGKPLGLVVRDGKTLHALKSISWWGVYCVKRGRARVLRASEYSDGMCDQAVQAGPRLLSGGAVVLGLKNTVARRTVVGINRRGEVLLVIADGLVSTDVLIDFLLQPTSQGGLDCPNALNLDGGGSTQLVIRTADFKKEIAGFSKVPVGFGVYPK